jgi:hypothetical protein
LLLNAEPAHASATVSEETSRSYNTINPSYTIEEFMRGGALVHVGMAAPEYVDSTGTKLSAPVVFCQNFCSYWCLNASTSNEFFYGKSNAVIIKRFSPSVFSHLINANPYEMMICGTLSLEAGDTIILIGGCHYPRVIKEGHQRYIDDGELGSNCFTARKEFINAMENWTTLGIRIIELDTKNQAAIEKCVADILKEQECWNIDLLYPFWDHTSPFFVNGMRISNHEYFFKNLIAAYPHISSPGYEFYSSRGIASLFRLLVDCAEGEIPSCPEMRRFLSCTVQHYPHLPPERLGNIVAQIAKLEEGHATTIPGEIEGLQVKETLSDTLTPGLIMSIARMSPEIFERLKSSLGSRLITSSVAAAYELLYLLRSDGDIDEITTLKASLSSASYEVKREIYKAYSLTPGLIMSIARMLPEIFECLKSSLGSRLITSSVAAAYELLYLLRSDGNIDEITTLKASLRSAYYEIKREIYKASPHVMKVLEWFEPKYLLLKNS